MNEILSRLHENRKQKKLNESALDEFWTLYDSDTRIADELTDIAEELGISSSEEPTEADAKRILKVFHSGYNNGGLSADELLSELIDACENIYGVSEVTYFKDRGLMTKNKGLVITTTTGEEFHLSLLGHYTESAAEDARDIPTQVKDALRGAGIDFRERGKSGTFLVVRKSDLVKASEIKDEIDTERIMTIGSQA